jgi:hypothetical protein
MGENFTSRGQSSLLGDNLAPGGQSLPLEARLRTGLREPTLYSWEQTISSLSGVTKNVLNLRPSRSAQPSENVGVESAMALLQRQFSSRSI